MAKPLVSDDLWAAVAPLLPPRPPRPKGGRPPVADRAALTGIVFVLRSGIPWEMLPQEMGCGSGMTCWRRLRDWQVAGVWDRLHRVCCWTAWAKPTLSTGAGRRWIAPACRQKGGPADRPEPDRPRATRRQAPPSDRPPWHSARRSAVARQPSRQRDAGGGGRRRAAGALAGRGAGLTSCTPTRPTIMPVAGARYAAAALSPAAPGAASTAASVWAATVGSSSARWLGSTAFAA